jgi:hypothetical protein
MNARLEETTSQADPIVRGIVVVTVAITIVGMLTLVRAAAGDRVPHVPAVRVQTRPPSRSRSTPSTPPAPASASASPRPAACPPSTRSPTSAPPGPWSPATAARRSTRRRWPGPPWPPATGPSPSRPTPRPRWSGRGSSEPAIPPTRKPARHSRLTCRARGMLRPSVRPASLITKQTAAPMIGPAGPWAPAAAAPTTIAAPTSAGIA